MKKVLVSLFAAACVLPIGGAFAQSNPPVPTRPVVTAESIIFRPEVTASSIIFRPDVTASSIIFVSAS
jgi:hypothetical protein